LQQDLIFFFLFVSEERNSDLVKTVALKAEEHSQRKRKSNSEAGDESKSKRRRQRHPKYSASEVEPTGSVSLVSQSSAKINLQVYILKLKYELS